MQSEKPHLCLIAQPNRYHRYLGYEIKKQNCFYIYYNIWKLKTISQYKSENNISKTTTFTYPFFNSQKKIYGSFPSNTFDYLKNIKKYTIIENPVDRIYQIHSHMEKVNKTMEEYVNCIMDLDTLIDLYIANPNNVIITNNYNGVIYITTRDSANQFKNLNEFEFVGTVEKMEKSLEVINDVFGTNIKYNTGMKRIPIDYENYRRSELETALNKQLNDYYKINDKL
jgi:hypothetical protein